VRILAFHSGPHDSAAAIFEDYDCIAAVQEERLTREKGSGGLPWLAIDEVLKIAGWSRLDVDAIATTRGLFPIGYVRDNLGQELYYVLRRALGEDLSERELAVLCQRRGTADTAALFKSEQFLRDQAFRPDIPIYFANHHEAHGLPALFYTDWDNALIYTGDGVGDNVSYGIRLLQTGRLECFYGDDRWLAIAHPHRNSIAMAYSFATEACGFRRGRHEGKLTGLAAHGSPTLAGAISRHYHLDDAGLVAADFTSWRAMKKTIDQICHGHSREEIAASIQAVVEDLIVRSVGHWLERTRARNLALSGGLFSNVRLNRLLAESLPLDEIFIFPAMGDEGLAVGAALCFLRERDGLDAWLGNRRRLNSLYLGSDHGERIDVYLRGIARTCHDSGNVAELAAELLASGRIGAVYTDRMEYGPRALGARSIIASPVEPSITEELNSRLRRSEFMPFAPYVLAEDAECVFEISSRNRYTARFMTICCGVRPQWRERLTAITHLDNTARPQILSDEDNPLFAAILRRFHERTAIPVLINTSFNIHEEPIINRPEECAKALLDGRVDFVVTANALYSMADAEEIIRAKSRRIKARGPDLTPRPVTSNATAI